MSGPGEPLRLGLVGTGGFGRFVVESTESLDEVTWVAAVDPRAEAAWELADAHGMRVHGAWQSLVTDSAVDAVVVATPPADHAEIVRAALRAGKHVFCEKPLALDAATAADLADRAVAADRVVVVDHVLRYNPLVRALVRLRDELLGPIQRFCFENDASDERLSPDHWFWDEARSGGIFVEHGVHFFDLAELLIGEPARDVVATSAHRPAGPVDLVSATVRHGDAALATHTHGFTHADRCERQLLRLDHGAAEVRVAGWIPVDAVVDVWTDPDGLAVLEGLRGRADELWQVDGLNVDPMAEIDVSVLPAADRSYAVGRGLVLDLPNRARVTMTLGGEPAKQRVYADGVRAAMHDLARCVRTGGRPVSGVVEATRAVAVAEAATRSSTEGRRVAVPITDPPGPAKLSGASRARTRTAPDIADEKGSLA